jgi:hypothetical protein
MTDPLAYDPMTSYSVYEMAKHAWLEQPGWTWDSALPLDWVNDVHARCDGLWAPDLDIVWAYGPKDSGFWDGGPFALTREGAILLRWYEQARGR